MKASGKRNYNQLRHIWKNGIKKSKLMGWGCSLVIKALRSIPSNTKINTKISQSTGKYRFCGAGG